MLEQLSDQVRECYERAAEAKARADETNDPALKAKVLSEERRWLDLARRIAITERERYHGGLAKIGRFGDVRR